MPPSVPIRKDKKDMPVMQSLLLPSGTAFNIYNTLSSLLLPTSEKVTMVGAEQKQGLCGLFVLLKVFIPGFFVCSLLSSQKPMSNGLPPTPKVHVSTVPVLLRCRR